MELGLLSQLIDSTVQLIWCQDARAHFSDQKKRIRQTIKEVQKSFFFLVLEFWSLSGKIQKGQEFPLTEKFQWFFLIIRLVFLAFPQASSICSFTDLAEQILQKQQQQKSLFIFFIWQRRKQLKKAMRERQRNA